MSWLFRFIMLSVVAAAAAGGWIVSGGLASNLAIDTVDARKAPYSVRVSGGTLSSRVAQALSVINAERGARREHGRTKVLILERVAFERSAGGVVARGVVNDLGAPRDVSAVIDAFDGSRGYLASGSSPLATKAGSTPFSVFLADDDRFESFSIRFLDQGMQEILTRTTEATSSRTPPLLMDDVIRPSDVTEVAVRLALLGYVSSASEVRDDIAALAVVDRFRRDHGIDGPRALSVGDLLALREVSPPSTKTVDLSSY